MVSTKNNTLKTMSFLAVSFVVIGSLGSSIYFNKSVSAFFFTPFRIYEFFFGIILVFLPELIIKNLYREIIFLLGGALIAFSTIGVDPAPTHTNYYSLIAAAGASLVIYSNNPNFLGSLLRNRLTVFIGKISYSLYLIHWPIFVLVSYYFFTSIENIKFPAMALSFVMAIFMYKFVETPFRQQTTSFLYKIFFFILPIMVIALSVVSVHFWKNNGWPWRFSDSKDKNIMTYVTESKKLSSANFKNFNIKNYDDWINGKVNVLVVGDSHSQDVFNALSLLEENQKKYNFHHTYLPESCFIDENYIPTSMQFLLSVIFKVEPVQYISPDCANWVDSAKNSLFTKKADFIILANNVPDGYMGKMLNYTKFFRSNSDAKIVMFGTNKLPYDPPTMLLLKSAERINKIMYEMDRKNIVNNNDMLRKAAKKAGVKFFNLYPHLCIDSAKQCNVFYNNRLLYEDNNHWSIDGEKHYGRILMERGILK